jgi:hypothetical protein
MPTNRRIQLRGTMSTLTMPTCDVHTHVGTLGMRVHFDGHENVKEDFYPPPPFSFVPLLRTGLMKQPGGSVLTGSRVAVRAGGEKPI